eukprot:SAG31_NODE_1513_length_8045_cov_5.748804_8_plen_102_part_00
MTASDALCMAHAIEGLACPGLRRRLGWQCNAMLLAPTPLFAPPGCPGAPGLYIGSKYHRAHVRRPAGPAGRRLCRSDDDSDGTPEPGGAPKIAPPVPLIPV